MDPLQLFADRQAALATTLPNGSPQLAFVNALPRAEHLAFAISDLPPGRPAVLRVADELAPPFEGVSFARWCEARGVLDERGLRVQHIRHSEPPQVDVQFLERIWARGEPGDAHAIELVRGNHQPAFLAAPEGARLLCALSHAQREAAVELLVPTYWNADVARARIAAAVHAATVNVGAVDSSGRLIAHARALSDRAKYAWIYDVVVADSWRGRGLGQALMRLILDHPLVRTAHQVLLATRDAQSLYAKFGFVDRKALPPLRPWASTEMLLRRAL